MSTLASWFGRVLGSLAICASPAVAHDWYVDANGSNHGDGSQGNPFNTIAKALNHSSNGDRILVAAGSYVEALDVSVSVTILGDAAGGTLVGGKGRPFTIESQATVWLENLVIHDGAVSSGSSSEGGGLLNQGSTTLTRCRIENCSCSAVALFAAADALGGGIFNRGVLLGYECAVTGCTATVSDTFGLGQKSAFGGGIYNTGLLKLFSCTISGNLATTTHNNSLGAAAGGGLYTWNSTVPVHLVNCTLSGNVVDSVATEGGGIEVVDGPSNYDHCTIASNTANGTFNGSGSAFGGGVDSVRGGARFTQTIVADNVVTSDGTATAPDFYGDFDSGGYNLLEDTGGAYFTGDTTGNQTGVDPLLQPLADNGGRVQTQALGAGSPCLDAGNPDPLASPAYDARDFPRALWDPATGVADVGAYEAGNGPAFLLTATPDVPLPAGVSLLLVNGGGQGQAPILLAAVAVNGAPTFVPVLFTSFDTSGVLYLAGTVPSGLSGTTIGLQTFSLDASGRTIGSNVETLVFQ